MDVFVNDKVRDWAGAQQQPIPKTYNARIGDVANDDNFNQWRHVGKSNSIYDTRLSGDLRLVAERSSTRFDVMAVYRHLDKGGKTKVIGATVDNYTR